MIITYHGDNFFRVQSGSTVLVVDPTSERMKPTVTVRTVASAKSSLGLPAKTVIETAGEYEVEGVRLTGLEIVEESTDVFVKTIFVISGIEDEMQLCFLGHLSEDIPGTIIDAIGNVDILFLPIGDKPYLSAETASKITKKIEPRTVIPAFHGKDAADKFLKEMGQAGEPQEKLVIKLKDIAEQNSKVVVLKKE